MKFYFREKETEALSDLENRLGDKNGCVLIHGRRKVGKTEFVKQFLSDREGVYLSITTNNSKLQLEDISTYLRTLNQFDFYIPKFNEWTDLFEFFFFLSKNQRFTLAIDEFHNLEVIDKNALSEFRKLYERNNIGHQLLTIFISSNINSIRKAFKDKNAPLYNISNIEIKIEPFNLARIISLYKLNNSLLSIKEIIKIYLVFGGLPKYYYLIDSYSLWDCEILDVLEKLVFCDYSPLGFEFKELLLNEFSKSNKTYLSILQSIATGNNTITEISKDTHVQATTLMKYLSELAYVKNIIVRKTPINADDKAASKYGKYFINSYFENFWFRFVQPNQIFFELRNYKSLIKIVDENIDEYYNERSYSLLKELFLDTSDDSLKHSFFPFTISNIGPIWNRKYKFEIAIVSQEQKQVLIFKVYPDITKISSEEYSLFTKMLNEIKEYYHGYNCSIIIISNEKLTDEELNLFRNKGIVNIRINDFLNSITHDLDSLTLLSNLFVSLTAV